MSKQVWGASNVPNYNHVVIQTSEAGKRTRVEIEEEESMEEIIFAKLEALYQNDSDSLDSESESATEPDAIRLMFLDSYEQRIRYGFVQIKSFIVTKGTNASRIFEVFGDFTQYYDSHMQYMHLRFVTDTQNCYMQIQDGGAWRNTYEGERLLLIERNVLEKHGLMDKLERCILADKSKLLENGSDDKHAEEFDQALNEFETSYMEVYKAIM